MSEKLKKLLENVIEFGASGDLWPQTIKAAEIILEGGYDGSWEDVEYLEGLDENDLFDFENRVSIGEWYWQLQISRCNDSK